jgi:acyl-CoA synthetase (NDP forming)
LLAGFRGSKPGDREAAIDAIVKISRLALEHPEIAEIEVNPLIVLDETRGAIAVDARVRVSETQHAVALA